MSHHHGPHCGCPKCREQIIYPTKHQNINKYSESVVEHVHPSHTTVTNHHLVKNKHLYPHSTSFQNTCNSVDVHGGPFPAPAPGQVAGAMSPGYGPGAVGGAMAPGCGSGHVAGAMHNPSYAPGAMNHGMHKHHGMHTHHDMHKQHGMHKHQGGHHHGMPHHEMGHNWKNPHGGC